MRKFEKVTCLKGIRESKGFTLQQVAKELNINPTVLYEIEKGTKSTISIRAMNIAKYYNLPIGDLFTPAYYRAKTIQIH